MATKRIKLVRPWSGHAAGEVIEEADFTVDSMVRKGYGIELPAAKPIKAKAGKGPPAETAMLKPGIETEDARPEITAKETDR